MPEITTAGVILENGGPGVCLSIGFIRHKLTLERYTELIEQAEAVLCDECQNIIIEGVCSECGARYEYLPDAVICWRPE